MKQEAKPVLKDPKNEKPGSRHSPASAVVSATNKELSFSPYFRILDSGRPLYYGALVVIIDKPETARYFILRHHLHAMPPCSRE